MCSTLEPDEQHSTLTGQYGNGVVSRRMVSPVLITVGVLAMFAAAFTWRSDRLYVARAELLLSADSDDEQVVGLLADPTVQSTLRKDIPKDVRIDHQRFSDDVIVVRATARGAPEAMRAANSFAVRYIDLRRQQRAQELRAGVDDAKSKIADMQRMIDAAAYADRDDLIQQQARYRHRLQDLEAEAELGAPVQLVTRADRADGVRPWSVPWPVVAALGAGVVALGVVAARRSDAL
jgi:hypothetical protein